MYEIDRRRLCARPGCTARSAPPSQWSRSVVALLVTVQRSPRLSLSLSTSVSNASIVIRTITFRAVTSPGLVRVIVNDGDRIIHFTPRYLGAGVALAMLWPAPTPPGDAKAAFILT
jgi:hypothetical protein